ncbi:hypothetical protein EDI_134100 [Entamoeba dispar SAW760]|uniref:Uncharacterized protein n=1 Tax=Entamoeba dispar (strain ATCC PRA-260 / SAW760) TaxID=370354 RepID=B0EKF7_ENTDS|nr:uncharacterized protein EDI_134100 [Entamoeba dispar SAW760]EDR24995.1 hypothetical protein EDI_134100 [Entamoeba dispar SAW760]|eukprot:EDR24995.1 hypothetical protein EDI_134100 [Entamoeba dispar SAW760]
MSSPSSYEPFVLGFGSSSGSYSKSGLLLSQSKKCKQTQLINESTPTQTDTSSTTIKTKTSQLSSSYEKHQNYQSHSQEKTIEYNFVDTSYQPLLSTQQRNILPAPNNSAKTSDSLNSSVTSEKQQTYVELLEFQLKKYEEIPWIKELRKEHQENELTNILESMYEEYCGMINKCALLETENIQLKNELKTIKQIHQLLSQYSLLHIQRSNTFLDELKEGIERKHIENKD